MKKCGNYNTCQCRGFRALELGRFWMFFHRFWWMFLCFNGCFHVAVHCFFMDFSHDFGVCPCFFHGFIHGSQMNPRYKGSLLEPTCGGVTFSDGAVDPRLRGRWWRIHGTSPEDLSFKKVLFERCWAWCFMLFQFAHVGCGPLPVAGGNEGFWGFATKHVVILMILVVTVTRRGATPKIYAHSKISSR